MSHDSDAINIFLKGLSEFLNRAHLFMLSLFLQIEVIEFFCLLALSNMICSVSVIFNYTIVYNTLL